MPEEKEIIDLGRKRKRKELNESYLSMFGGAIKKILQQMFGDPIKNPYKIRGNRKEVKKFADTLQKEKDYMEAFMKYGLDDPKTLKRKGKLEKAVKNFERETGITWPFD